MCIVIVHGFHLVSIMLHHLQTLETLNQTSRHGSAHFIIVHNLSIIFIMLRYASESLQLFIMFVIARDLKPCLIMFSVFHRRS